MTRPARHARRRGFTLLEVLIAMSIMALGSVAILSLFPAGLRMQQRSWTQAAGSRDAQSVIAVLAHGGYGVGAAAALPARRLSTSPATEVWQEADNAALAVDHRFVEGDPVPQRILYRLGSSGETEVATMILASAEPTPALVREASVTLTDDRLGANVSGLSGPLEPDSLVLIQRTGDRSSSWVARAVGEFRVVFEPKPSSDETFNGAESMTVDLWRTTPGCLAVGFGSLGK